MRQQDIEQFLRLNEGKCVRITFLGGLVQRVIIGSVDDEGFVHSGPEGTERDAYWSDFEGVESVTADE